MCAVRDDQSVVVDLSWFVAEARGWKLCIPRESKKRKGGVGSIVREQGASVWGVVFAVSERDLVRLDAYEGVNSKSYKREPIDVVDSQGRQSTVWTYIAVPMGQGAFAPHKDYIALYVRGAVYYGLPPSLRGFPKKACPRHKADLIYVRFPSYYHLVTLSSRICK